MNPPDRLKSAGASRPGRSRTFSSLRNINYRYLLVSSAFISAGNQVQQIAMGWLVLELTDSPFWVGVVLGIRALPILLAGPLAGVAIDRLDRKKLFLAAQLALVAMAFLFALDVQRETVTVAHALIFSFLLGLDSALSQPVRQALIANTVPREDLTNAIALNNSANGVTQSIAPLISGTMIAALGVSGNFYIQGAAYLAVFIIILPMRTPYRQGVAEHTSVAKNFMEGIRHIRGDSVLLLLILLVFIPSLFIHSTQNQLSVFAVEVFRGGPLSGPLRLGLLGAGMGLGSLMATFTIASLGNYQARGMLNTGSVILVTVTLTLFGLSSYLGLGPSLIVIGIMGFFNTGFRLVNNALVQSRIPDYLRGRITSVYVLDHGFQPVGSLVLGLLAEGQVLGIQKAVILVGLVAVAVTVFMGLRFRQLWSLK
jgi:MFS family permease